MGMLVGRDRELEVARELVASVASGAGRLVVVDGEAGTGKTAWCEATAALAREAGLQVAWAACWESELQPPLEPWWLVLEQLGTTDVAHLRADPFPVGRDLEERRAWFAEVAAALRRRARAQPALVVVDDVHWADDASAALLEHVARAVRSAPLGLVVTARSGSGPTPRVALVQDLRRVGQQVTLGGLDDRATGTLLERVLGQPVAPAQAAAWRAHTGGNPLFLLELARSSAGLGVPLPSDGSDLPPSLTAAFADRLRLGSAAEHELLTFLAVLGGECRLSDLVEVAGIPPAEVPEVVDRLAERWLVSLHGSGSVALVHPLLRTAVLGRLGLAGRVRAHERVAEVLLAADAAGRPADPEAIAHHLVAAAPAGHARDAVRWSVRAADHSLAAGAFERSAEWCQRGLDVLAMEPDAAAEGELLLRRAEAERAAGRADAARATLRLGAEGARVRRDPAMLARCALTAAAGGGFEVSLFDDEQDSWLEEALRTLPEQEHSLRSQVLARLSVSRSVADDLGRRVARSEAAVAEARGAGDDRALAFALAANCDTHAGPADTSRRNRTAQEIVTLGRRLRDPRVELLGHRLRLVALLEDGDSVAADGAVERYQRLALALGQPLFLWFVPLWRAMRALAEGRVAESRASLEHAEALGREAASENAEILVATQRMIGGIELADGSLVDRMLEETLLSSGVDQLGAQMAGAYGLGLATSGRLDEAAGLLTRWTAEILSAPEDSEWAPMMVQLSDTMAILGGHPLAGAVHDRLRPFAGHHAIEGIGAMTHGAVDRVLGRLCALLGDRDAARQHFDHALASNRAAGLTLAVARTHRDAGLALHDRAELEQALAGYRAMGVPGRETELEEALRARPPAGRGAPAERRAAWRRDGEGWLVGWGDLTANVRDRKGMADIAVLLTRPGTDVPVLDLYGVPGEGASPDGDLGEVIDETARRQYRRRLAELETELDDADERGDAERSARLADERDALVTQLSAAFGLGGRARRSGGTVERARTAVTARIRDAERAVEAVIPALGRHLRNAIRTGSTCRYDPDEPVRWEL